MTEFPGTGCGRTAYEVTGLTAAAEVVIAARPELVWDLVADVTSVGEWSPECIRATWLGEPGRPTPRAQSASSAVLPNPAGAHTSTRPLASPSASASTKRRRGTKPGSGRGT